SYLHELIHDVYNQINENINETDNTYLLSSLKDYEVITPDYEQAFLNIDYSKFDHALKTFKNTKYFFIKNESEKLKDIIYEILNNKIKNLKKKKKQIKIQIHNIKKKKIKK